MDWQKVRQDPEEYQHWVMLGRYGGRASSALPVADDSQSRQSGAIVAPAAAPPPPKPLWRSQSTNVDASGHHDLVPLEYLHSAIQDFGTRSRDPDDDEYIEGNEAAVVSRTIREGFGQLFGCGSNLRGICTHEMSVNAATFTHKMEARLKSWTRSLSKEVREGCVELIMLTSAESPRGRAALLKLSPFKLVY